MLTRSDFRIQEAPVKKSRDSKFAYEMYLDTLLLILKLSGRKISPKDEIPNLATAQILPAISNAKMISSLASNSELQELITKYNRDLSQYSDCLIYLLDEISESAAAKDYSKKRKKTMPRMFRSGRSFLRPYSSKMRNSLMLPDGTKISLLQVLSPEYRWP